MLWREKNPTTCSKVTCAFYCKIIKLIYVKRPWEKKESTNQSALALYHHPLPSFQLTDQQVLLAVKKISYQGGG